MSTHQPFIAEFTRLLRQIAADYLAGAALPDLAAEHGLPPGALEEAFVQVGFLPVGSMARQYWRRVPMARIAEDHGVNERTLYRLLARHGIERNGGTFKHLPLSREEIAARYLRGREEQQKIAADLGVSPNVISRRLREAGVQVPVGARPLALPVQQIRERRNRGKESSLWLLSSESRTPPSAGFSGVEFVSRWCCRLKPVPGLPGSPRFGHSTRCRSHTPLPGVESRYE